jgi:hypothetical protein
MCRPRLLSNLVQIDMCAAHIESISLANASERLLLIVYDLFTIMFCNKMFEKDLTTILITYGHKCTFMIKMVQNR